MNLLFIGDIVGKGARKAVKTLVPEIRHQYCCSFVVANGENSASGSGITDKCIKELSESVDVITLGDHVWDQKNFDNDIRGFSNVIRPANLNPHQPGRGYGVFKNPAGGEIAIINLIGRTFMKAPAFCPFLQVKKILEELPSYVKCILVDFHAEVTSEKITMGRYLDGKVTAVLGTHTHVQTADACVHSGGTAYITDVGMVGGQESVIGRKISSVIHKFTTDMPCRLEVVETGKIRLDAVIISYDMKTGRATAIKPISVVTEI